MIRLVGSGRSRAHEQPRGFRTRVISARSLTPTSCAIELEKPSSFKFLATQFTFLQLVTEAGVDVRPMSLAISPTRPHLEYAVRMSSSWYKRAFAALRPGDEVAVLGPLGDFVLDETRPAILVAGGIGVTPLKGMAEYAADRGLTIPVQLVYSNRTEEEIAYRAELAALETQNPNFSVFHTLTGAPDAGWEGATGRIDRALLREAARGLTDPIYYVSGTPTLVLETWHQLHEIGSAASSIKVEAFRGYR